MNVIQNEFNYYDQFIDETLEEYQFVDNIESLYDATMNSSAMEVFPDINSEIVDIEVVASIESCGIEVISSESCGKEVAMQEHYLKHQFPTIKTKERRRKNKKHEMKDEI